MPLSSKLKKGPLCQNKKSLFLIYLGKVRKSIIGNNLVNDMDNTITGTDVPMLNFNTDCFGNLISGHLTLKQVIVLTW
jgi:hypothetical protein